jgi:hypothetical protein
MLKKFAQAILQDTAAFSLPNYRIIQLLTIIHQTILTSVLKLLLRGTRLDDFLFVDAICKCSLLSCIGIPSLQMINSSPQQAQFMLSEIKNRSHRTQFFEPSMYVLLLKPNISHNLLQTIITNILLVLIGVPQILLLSVLLKN